MEYVCLRLKKNSEIGKQYLSFLKNIDKCINILKRELDEVVGAKKLIGIDKETLKLYVHEKDRYLIKGVSKNKEIFKNGESEIFLYPILKSSKVFKEYIKILEKNKEIVKKSKKPKIDLKNCCEKKIYRYISQDVFVLVMNKDFINQDENFEKFSVKKYIDRELEHGTKNN